MIPTDAQVQGLIAEWAKTHGERLSAQKARKRLQKAAAHGCPLMEPCLGCPRIRDCPVIRVDD